MFRCSGKRVECRFFGETISRSRSLTARLVDVLLGGWAFVRLSERNDFVAPDLLRFAAGSRCSGLRSFISWMLTAIQWLSVSTAAAAAAVTDRTHAAAAVTRSVHWTMDSTSSSSSSSGTLELPAPPSVLRESNVVLHASWYTDRPRVTDYWAPQPPMSPAVTVATCICPHCQRRVRPTHYEDHVTNHCYTVVRVTCSSGCGARIAETDVDDHRLVCPRERVECIVCSAIVVRQQLSNHLESAACLAYQVKCSWCEHWIPRVDYGAHYAMHLQLADRSSFLQYSDVIPSSTSETPEIITRPLAISIGLHPLVLRLIWSRLTHPQLLCISTSRFPKRSSVPTAWTAWPMAGRMSCRAAMAECFA